MKLTYLLQGLSCANCAAQIASETAELKGVETANCSVATGMLTVVFQTSSVNVPDFTQLVTEITHRHEPHVVVALKGGSGNAAVYTGGSQKARIIRFSAGLCLLIAAVVTGEESAALVLYLLSYITVGYEVIIKAAKNLLRGKVLDENCLMSIATFGAFAIGEYTEASAVMLFFLIGEYFQELAVTRSRRSIAELMDIRPDYANITQNGEIKRVAPELVNIDDVITVKPGERIPLDGIITEGESLLDTKALTGEALPRRAKMGDTVLSGFINQSGVLYIRVTSRFAESTAAKILELVENAAEKKAKTENFITKFARYYTPAVVISAALLAVLPVLFFGGEPDVWLHRALVFLVVSCPCALVVSIPLGFFAGLGCASRNGILVKGGNYLEALANLDIAVFDKTGTLTKGIFTVREIIPALGYDKNSLLKLAALAESCSNHPIAASVTEAYGETINTEPLKYEETAGYGVCAVFDDMRILAGNEKLMRKESVRFTPNMDNGTKVYIALNGRFAGCIIIGDEIKEDSAAAIAGLKALGIRKTVMLTGDDEQTAKTTAKELAIDEYYAKLLPADKITRLEETEKEKRLKGTLAFMGDGINDAPVLTRADIGIAMGGIGSDAAIEAADVVLMTDEPSKLIKAVRIAKATNRVVKQNIIFALGIKGVFLALGAFGLSGMWEAVFADVGVALLAVLNASRVLKFE